jgi:hypothetical protein
MNGKTWYFKIVFISQLPFFWKSKMRLMSSPCCLFTIIYLYAFRYGSKEKRRLFIRYKPDLSSERMFLYIFFIASGVGLTPGEGDCGAIGGMRIGRGNRSSRRKPAPEPLCPPQIPLDQTRDRTRAAAVGERMLHNDYGRMCSITKKLWSWSSRGLAINRQQ